MSKFRKVFPKKADRLPKTTTAFELWDEYQSNIFGKDLSTSGVMKPHSMYADFNAIYSGEDIVTYFYMLDKFTKELPRTYKRDLRSVRSGNVKISFIDNLDYHTIDWDSTELKNRINAWGRIDREDESKGNKYDIRESLADQSLKDARLESANYFSEATGSGKATFISRTMVIVTGSRGRDFDKTIYDLNSRFKDMGIAATRILGDVPKKVGAFLPTVKSPDKLYRDSVSKGMVLTDEIIARTVTFSHGNTSYGDVYFGTDVYTGLPASKTPKQDRTAAENWFITAETGGGKSFFVKTILLQLLAKTDHVATIMDIEGDEYLPLASFFANDYDVVVLHIGEGSGNYFDPVEIILSGNEEEDKEMFTFSMSYTQTIFKTLLAETLKKENILWMGEVFVNTGIRDFYHSLGVKVDDMSTWENTRGKTLFDVYKYIVSTVKPPNDDAQKEFDLFKGVLDPHFSEDGVNSTFGNRISFDRIKNTKLVLCDFGMKGRSDSTIDPVAMALMQLYTAFISHLRSIFSYNKGLVNVKVWEEFQRWGGFPGAEKTIKTPLTGGRKLGDINIIVSNQPGKMLDENEPFGIFQTITTYAIGATADSTVRKGLADRLASDVESRDYTLMELDRINANRGSLDQSKTLGRGESYNAFNEVMKNRFDKSFLVSLDRTSMYITKAILPEHVATSDLFRTGVVQNKDEA